MVRARDNPFAVHRVLRERYRLDEAEWAQLFARLEAQGRRGALVGPQGSGKTTLIEDLASRMEARGWKVILVRLSAERECFTPRSLRAALANAGTGDFVLLDGAEQLGQIAWWRFRRWTRRVGGLVITSHQAGRLPLLRRCETSPALLHELVASLGVEFSLEESAALHARHRGNLRFALRELYDGHADAREIRVFSPAERRSHS